MFLPKSFLVIYTPSTHPSIVNIYSHKYVDVNSNEYVHFTVRRFICVCVYLCFCFILHSCCINVSTVGWTWWDWSLILWTYLPSVLSHCWLGHLTNKNPSPIWPIMCWWDVKPSSINQSNHDLSRQPAYIHLSHMIMYKLSLLSRASGYIYASS